MEEYICKFCGKTCKNANSLRNHERLCKLNPERQLSYIIKFNENNGGPWNKGKTKETDERLAISGKHFSERVKNGEIKINVDNRPKHLSEKVKKKISESMKKAHREHRAHNIGNSRWNNEHSWPEKWFIKVLKNEFNMIENIDYKTEMPFYRFSLDFAWPGKKLCIEIDGEQHERFEDYKIRDMEKDKLLKENNWQIFRIKWKNCCNNTKYYINLVREIFKNIGLQF